MLKLKALVLALVSVLVLTGCTTPTTPTTRTVYSGPTVRVERQGRKTIVHDLTANRRFTLTERRAKKSEQTGAPKTLVSTGTLKITVQGSTTTIKADGVRITITRHDRLRR